MSIPKISVVVSVKNEISSIKRLIKSLLNQSIKPNELIIVDGGSTDGTWELLKTYKGIKPFRIIDSNRAHSRNFGISEAKNSLIAITDAGCFASPKWIKNLLKCKNMHKSDVVAGYYSGDSKSVFEKCLVPYVLVMPDKVNSADFLPATRSMLITKSAWKRNGRFPEEFWHNEDYVFSRRMNKNKLKVSFCKKAIVNWVPRKNLLSSIKMFFRFALGDSESRIFRSKVGLIFGRYLVGFVLIFLLRIDLLIPLMGLYIFWSIKKNYKYVRHISAFFWLPVLQLSSDLAILSGTLAGIVLPRNVLLKYLIK